MVVQIDLLFMSWMGIAVISVLVLQNHMDLLKGELGSSNKTCVTATLDRNTGASMECEMVSLVTEEEATTILSVKTEPSESCVPVVSLPAPISVCHCETKFWP